MRSAQVGEVSQQLRGVTFSKADAIDRPSDGYVAVLTASNIQDGVLDTSSVTYVPAHKVSDRQIVQRHDVIVCASSGSLKVVGKAAQSDGQFTGGFGAFLKVLRPGPDVDPRYFAHYFQTPSYRRIVSSLAAGANINNLKNEHLDSLVLPLPPLPEQRRIAAILDHADALRTKRRQVLAHLDSLASTAFLDLFGPPKTWPDRWTMTTIGDLSTMVTYGTASKAGESGAWPILRMGNVTDDGHLDLYDLKYVDLEPQDEPKYTLRAGDMLFNRTNSKEKVGKAAVVRSSEKLAFAGYLVRVRFDDSATAEFVAAYLRSAHGAAVRRKLAKAAVNQANINASEMRRIPVADAPAGLKQQFEHILAAIETQRQSVLAGLRTDDELFASLQSRAFRGEL
ncbi:restriction endonuclease subunit S [Gordonia sp. VNK21]|uniref:restriction endonuclease subunit S n=1 Tax=Gordonia sp. VNK21 TaxID=3382483 RepID=UPI0038D384AA